MSSNLAAITGIGSVSPYGPLGGLIQPRSLEPESITAWTTAGLRRAFVMKPFRPANVVPGLKTRRLDRLSAWALVASSLAIQDAGIDLSSMDRSRIAVVFGTGFGCAELTEAFYQSAAVNGWGGTDPSPFPEGLANAPASHVALWHGLRGPNITVGSKGLAGESALIQAASLLRYGQGTWPLCWRVIRSHAPSMNGTRWRVCCRQRVTTGRLCPKATVSSPAKEWLLWCWNRRGAGKRALMRISDRAAGPRAETRRGAFERCLAAQPRE